MLPVCTHFEYRAIFEWLPILLTNKASFSQPKLNFDWMKGSLEDGLIA